ncbi:membrane hypothetical protein [Actinacidiphila cocklensis]|uniref:Major Facilitator Superfamily protein n=1 Tax=Actinacidiphila cocklensis TaxID=887465 RepID=A0A9W4DI90_9ACTN|nr:membrane hypothetical protein [Actinacidiphila cocklensis]
MFGGAITCLLFVLNDLHHAHWVLVGWESHVGAPFIDVRMLVRNRALTATYIRVSVTFLLIYSIFYGVSQWLQEGRGLSTTGVGLVMLPMSVLAALVSIPFARRESLAVPLLATAAAALTGSAGLLVFTHTTPVWILVLVIMVFGITSGLGMLGNQAALYRQAPPESIGVAAGLMRTFTYLGAILSSGLISLAFGRRATDHGLHTVVWVLLAIGVLLVGLTLAAVRGRHAAGPETHGGNLPPASREQPPAELPEAAG